MTDRKRINFVAIIVLILAVVLTSVIFSLGNMTASALSGADLSGLAAKNKVGNLVDLYDSATQKLNTTVGQDLVDKLFGTDDPVNYIKTNGAADYNTHKTEYPTGTDPYYVVPSSQIISKAKVDDKGLVVKLGNLEWMVASLTLADVGSRADQKDNVIMTLYLANPSAVTLTYGYVSSNAQGASMYSSSKLRNRLLNKDNSATDDFSQYAMFRSGTFAQNYIVQPKYVKYQEIESQYNRTSPIDGFNCNLPNDAYGTITTTWTSISYSPGFSYNASAAGGLNATYEDWKEDYIWLPSSTEVGSSNVITTPMWGLTNDQRKSDISAWTRSGFPVNYTAMMVLRADGTMQFGNNSGAGPSHTLRPAIHLNINEIAGRINPADVTTTYNGKTQTLKSIFDDNASQVPWYRVALEDPTKVSVSYAGDVKNVGSYTVTMTIQNAVKDTLKWLDWQTNSSLTRTISIKIEQAELTAKFDTSTSPPTPKVDTGFCDTGTAGEELKNKILRIHYTGTTGQTSYDSYDEPSQVGFYNATIEINPSVAGSANYKLKNSSDHTDTVEIKTSQVTLPSVMNEAGDVDSWYTYGDSSNGEYYYIIDGYEPTKMNVEIASGYEGKFTWDPSQATVLVTEAGIYTNALKVSLLNPYDKVTGAGRNVWDDKTNDTADKFLSFTVNKMELKIDFVTDDGTIHVPLGNTCSVKLRFTSKPLNSSDKIDLQFTATSTRAGSTPTTVFEKYEFTKSSPNLVDITFDISSIKVAGSYTIAVVASDVNYNVTLTRPITLSLDRSSQSQDLVWWLWENGAESASQNAAVGATDVNLTAASLTYDKNKSYAVHATAPFGYTLDGVAETTLDGSVSVLSSVQDAGNYVTTVKIKKDGQSTTTTYTLRWTIAKAKFDLSSVKWTGDGKLEYNGQEQHPTINAATLPDGLLVDEINDLGGKDVDAYGTASVTFKLASGYENNYLLPVSGGKGTSYDFAGDDDFEWLKPWEIIPAVLKLEWSKQDITDDNTGNEFSVYGLKDPVAEGKVEYVYYLSDVNGKKPTDGQTALSIDDLKADFSPTDKKYYLAYPSIRSGYDKNYKFPNGTADYSPVFSVGGGSDSVTVSLSKTEYEYNRKPVSLKLNIVGAATLSQLALTYYTGSVADAANKLTDAPTDAGNYLVVITANAPNLMLSGTTQFEFEITKSIISTTWKTAAKPPVLDLKYGQINGIHYDIFDGNNTPVASISDIKAGDYKIQATITDVDNYIFDDGTTVTVLVDFTVKAGDAVHDPNDPKNPHYPQTDPDDPGATVDPGDEGGNGGGNKVKEFFEKLLASHFPLWQVGVMAVSGLLTLIFLIKAIQYGNRARKAKGAKKAGAKAYAALLPIFSGDIVALGLSNKIWTIMAFAMAGLALLMLVIALILRGNWKKAEAAKEAAGGGGSSDAQRSNEFKELKEQLALMTSQQAANSGQGNAESSMAIIEAMRREMMDREERYRRDEEERRRNDEERHRQEMAALREEQAKRDDAMKLMLANMMGRSAGDDGFAYATLDDTDMLVQRVIAGLLPAVQQMMPEPTAYLAAPAAQNEELMNIVEEQNAQMQEMAAQMRELKAQLAVMHESGDAVVISDNNEELLAKMNEMQQQISKLGKSAPSADNGDELKAMTDEMNALRKQIANLANQPATVVAADNSGEIKAMADEMDALRKQVSKLSESQYDMAILDDEDDDFDFDDEEEWDSILDEDEDDNFVESVIIEADGSVRKVSPNFRMRLKQSSDQNREWYAAIKNLFCSQKGVTYRVCKRVEKIRYQGNVIAVIGIAKRSLKLWLALKPYEYDARRYHHKDVSDKPRFVDVPMYVRVGSDRALTRAQELILALFQEQAMEARKRYTDRDIQELIFTLKYNKLLTKKGYKQMLTEVMHVHDCGVLDNEIAETCIELKNVDAIDDRKIETVKLDDIDANFLDGNRVTLDRLRKVGLVSEKCTGYVVTAGQRLTKPLIVVANDFTLEAVKLIVLTGGRAVKLNKI